MTILTERDVARKSEKKSRTQALAESLLRDRAERAARKAVRSSIKIERGDFDPFEPTRWRVIAGGNPGYLVATPMRRTPVGWFLGCDHCGAEFESSGWKYCSTCMELPAEDRRSRPPGRSCLRCNGVISPRRRADAKYCSAKCAKAAENARSYGGSAHPKFRGDRCEKTQQNQSRKNVLIGPTDWPINLVGGDRRRGDLRRHGQVGAS
jgi:hypothetical protein